MKPATRQRLWATAAIIILFAILLTASGCASGPPIDERLNTWLGLNVSEYITANGPPIASATVGDLTYFTWSSSVTIGGGNVRTTCSSYYPYRCTTHVGQPTTLTCTINLTTDTHGTIIAWRAKGAC